MARTLIIVGLVIAAIGVLWPWLGQVGLGRLPGDFVIRRGNCTFYVPIATCLIVSVSCCPSSSGSSTGEEAPRRRKPIEGEVLAVGPGARDETGKAHPLEVRNGDRVLFAKWPGAEVLIGGEDRLIPKESDILGVIEGDRRATARSA